MYNKKEATEGVGDKHLKLYKLIFNATENSDR
jgi:hypothetical protein